jgi:hypothetical protein
MFDSNDIKRDGNLELVLIDRLTDSRIIWISENAVTSLHSGMLDKQEEELNAPRNGGAAERANWV